MFNRILTPNPDMLSLHQSARQVVQSIYDIDERCIDAWADNGSTDTVVGGAPAGTAFARQPTINADKLAIFSGSTLQLLSGFKVCAGGTHANGGGLTAGLGLDLVNSASTRVVLMAPTLQATGATGIWWAEFDVMFTSSGGAGLVYSRQMIAGAWFLYRAAFTASTFYSKSQSINVMAAFTAAGSLTLDFLHVGLYR